MASPTGLKSSSTNESSAVSDTVIVSCRGCEKQLPVRLAQGGERPALWQCMACEAKLPGIIVSDSPSNVLSGIRLADLHFEVEEVPKLPGVLYRLAKLMAEQTTDSAIAEKRRSVRVPQQLDVSIALLDEHYGVVGEACRGIVHNISEHGIGFLSVFPIDTPKVAIELGRSGSRRLQAFGRVVRCQELSGKYFEVGVDLEMRLGRWML